MGGRIPRGIYVALFLALGALIGEHAHVGLADSRPPATTYKQMDPAGAASTADRAVSRIVSEDNSSTVITDVSAQTDRLGDVLTYRAPARDPLGVAREIGSVRLSIADSLPAGEPVDGQRLTAASAAALRGRAAKLRELHTRTQALGVGTPGTYLSAAHQELLGEQLRAVRGAGRLLEPVYPGLPDGLDALQLAAVLESLAAAHEDASLRSRHDEYNVLAATGKILPHVVPPRGLPGTAGTRQPGDLLDLLTEHQELYTELEQGVHRSAELAIEDLVAATKIENPSDLVNALSSKWMLLGHRRLIAVLTAVDQVGTPYRFAGRDPRGFDCSGLTSYAWGTVGVYLKTFSFYQREQTHRAERLTQLQAGDLFFYERMSATSQRPDSLSGHVGIYLGVENLMLDANQGTGDVRVGRIDEKPLWGLGVVRPYEESVRPLILP